MIKKNVAMILVVCLLMLSFSSNALAAEQETAENPVDEVVNYSLYPTYFTTTIKDSKGNKYLIYGALSVSGKTVTVTTEYDVTYIGDGYSSATVYGYTKTLGAKANVSMSGGATNTVGGYGVTRTGKTGRYTPSKTFLYNITSLLGDHRFSCNGKSYTGTTGW